jgi:hypothetical protein
MDSVSASVTVAFFVLCPPTFERVIQQPIINRETGRHV